jgi:membrane protein implicated in regulation of membrane protease activity
MSIWFWFWALLAAILIVLEIFTAGFFMLPFGVGAAAAAAVTVLAEDQFVWQWAAFIVVSGVALVLLRRFASSITHDPPERVGADRVLGKCGHVVEGLASSSPNRTTIMPVWCSCTEPAFLRERVTE